MITTAASTNNAHKRENEEQQASKQKLETFYSTEKSKSVTKTLHFNIATQWAY